MFLYEDGANPDEDLGEVDSTETEGVAVSKYVLNCVFHALLLHCSAVNQSFFTYIRLSSYVVSCSMVIYGLHKLREPTLPPHFFLSVPFFLFLSFHLSLVYCFFFQMEGKSSDNQLIQIHLENSCENGTLFSLTLS